jgi:hypothetical protein
MLILKRCIFNQLIIRGFASGVNMFSTEIQGRCPSASAGGQKGGIMKI